MLELTANVKKLKLLHLRKEGDSKHEHWKYQYKNIESVNGYTYVSVYVSLFCLYKKWLIIGSQRTNGSYFVVKFIV